QCYRHEERGREDQSLCSQVRRAVEDRPIDRTLGRRERYVRRRGCEEEVAARRPCGCAHRPTFWRGWLRRAGSRGEPPRRPSTSRIGSFVHARVTKSSWSTPAVCKKATVPSRRGGRLVAKGCSCSARYCCKLSLPRADDEV